MKPIEYRGHFPAEIMSARPAYWYRATSHKYREAEESETKGKQNTATESNTRHTERRGVGRGVERVRAER